MGHKPHKSCCNTGSWSCLTSFEKQVSYPEGTLYSSCSAKGSKRKRRFRLTFLPFHLHSICFILVAAPHTPRFTRALPSQVLNKEFGVLTIATSPGLSPPRRVDIRVPSALPHLLPRPALEFLTRPFYIVFVAHEGLGHLYFHQAGSLGGDGK